MSMLGLAMIVRDEEDNLPRCLTSIKGIFDQLVIVDTGSIDRTVDIAASFGADIHNFKWIDDFSAARNFSFSKCSCSYVMWLDADDELSEESRRRLLALKQNLNAADTYLMPYNYAQDEFGRCACMVYNFRIIKNHCGVQWRWPIHEVLDIPVDWRMCTTNIEITHRRSGTSFVNDLGRNLRILKDAVTKNPKEPRLLFYYAKELFSDNKIEECLPAFEKFYQNGGGWHEDQVNGYFMVAMSYWKLGNEDKAIDYAMKGIRLDPRWAEFYVIIGQIHYNHERWPQAIPWFEIASKLSIPNTWGTVLPDNYGWTPADRLCMCYSRVGRLQESYEANEKALSYRPTDTRLLYNREFLRNILFPGRVTDRPIRLSLGGGNKPIPSYRNTDLFPGPNVQEVFDQSSIPYNDASIHSIYSEHALEHSAGHRVAEETIKEWSRVLRHGGHLRLEVPDLEACCKGFIESEDRERRPNERWTEREWYLYTLFGIQDLTNEPHPDGQFHRTGFYQGRIKRLLEKNGFEIQDVRTSNSYGTPSLNIDAVQVKQPIKVAWYIPGQIDENHGSLRIRRLNIHKWLTGHNVNSKIVNNLNIDELRQADVVIFISFGSEEQTIIEQLHRYGVKCVFDMCEDIHSLPYQTETLGMMDTIICCSAVLAENSQIYGRTVVIKDAYE